MENFTSEDTLCTLAFNVVFFLSALLSFACSASLMLLGVVYRNNSFWKSTALIGLGIVILIGVAWGMETLNWSVPKEMSLAAILVVGPAWLALLAGFIFVIVLEYSHTDKNKAGNCK